MTEVNKEELRRRAERCLKVASEGGRFLGVVEEEFHEVADPFSVIALLDELDLTKGRLHEVATLCAGVEQERDQLRAVVEALRNDAERYRWLRDKQTFIWLIQDWFPKEGGLTDVDAEIDAAMTQGGRQNG
jgi:hypothetical protein